MSELICIFFVLDEVDLGKGYFFGKKVIEVLDKVLEISEKLGFRIFKDLEGYYGYLEIGLGDELFGILCYMDVVLVGDENNWEMKLFDLIVKDGWLVGCGF